MCGGSPKVDTSYQDFQIAEAERARAEEEARQGRISSGLNNIKAVFDGGDYDGQSYAGVSPLLAQREQAQKDFYLPQLENQFNTGKEQLTFALARAGLLNSSAAGKKQAELGEQYALQRGDILSRIAQDIAGTRTRINQNRSSIESGLRASGDATAATNQALQAAVAFREDQPTFSPLGNVFYGLTQGIGAANAGYQNENIRKLANPDYGKSAGRLVGT